MAEVRAECYESDCVKLEGQNPLEIVDMLLTLGRDSRSSPKKIPIYGNQKIFTAPREKKAINDDNFSTSSIEELDAMLQ